MYKTFQEGGGVVGAEEETSTDQNRILGFEFEGNKPVCRGDDTYKCRATNPPRYICDNQKCDGTRDCPEGDDETHPDCGEEEYSQKPSSPATPAPCLYLF